MKSTFAANRSTVLTLGSSGKASHVKVFVRHEVTDYADWRKYYDAFRANGLKMGVTWQGVFQSVDDPNDVIVMHDFAKPDAAKAFLTSPDLKAAMDQAGVGGAPQVWYTTRAWK